MALGIFLVDISREINKSGHFAHPTDLLRTAVKMEQISLEWLEFSLAELFMPKHVLGFLAEEENSKWLPQGVTRPYHAHYRREEGKEKEWQAVISMSVTFPSLLSHPFRGGRPRTEKNAQWSLNHLAAIFTWLLLSISSLQRLELSLWLVPLSFLVNYELCQLNPTGTFVWSESNCRLQCQVLVL